MKIKASKQVQVTTKVDFKIGNRLMIDTGKIKLKIKEIENNKIEINFDKPYKIEKTNRKKRLIIYPKVIRRTSTIPADGMVPDINEYVNWSAIGRLLVGNTSTIRKGYIPKKQQERINELLKVINEWILKQQDEL